MGTEDAFEVGTLVALTHPDGGVGDVERCDGDRSKRRLLGTEDGVVPTKVSLNVALLNLESSQDETEHLKVLAIQG